jgi:transposase
LVVNLATETDIERLRLVALGLEAEVRALHERLARLAGELAMAKGATFDRLQMELADLKAQLDARQRALFSPTSEKQKRDSKPTKKTPQTGHGPTPQPELPIVEELHTLDEADQMCPVCGDALAEMDGQFEESEEVDIIERTYRIVRHKRQKYRCTCKGCVDTALGPSKLVVGGRYSVDFAAAIALDKYLEHNPLARQVRRMARAGLTVTTATLWDQLSALSRHLKPTYDALQAYILAAPVIGADETTWQMMSRGSKKWWAWSITSPDAVWYRIDASRSAEAANRLLGNYAGTVVVDGYKSYTSWRTSQMSRGEPQAELAHCMAHVRRKFVEAEPSDPRARAAIDLIARLYEIEARVREEHGDGDLATHLAAARDVESRPIVKALKDWMLTVRSLRTNALGKAILYADGLGPGLYRFLDDPAVPIDNNAAERGMRSVALGRKNHYGSRSKRGTEVAALFYSLLETAKLTGINPAAYLAEATRRAIANPGTVTLPQTILTETA